MSNLEQVRPVRVEGECAHVDLDVRNRVTRHGKGFILRVEAECKTCGVRMHFPVGRDRYASAATIPFFDRALTEEEMAQSGPSKSEVGPGTEMLSLTAELGIDSPPGCGCKSTAATMDRLGVAGCRQRFNELLLTIESNYAAWNWRDKLHAATKAAWKAAGLGVNPIDPVKSLLELSIERAEAKAKADE